MINTNFTFIDLFCGIGGFHSGIAPLGGKCLFASDILPIACETYFLNYGIKPHGDITNIQSISIPNHDLLCAGFPCQSFSNVGKKGGLEDPRGKLVNEIFRILKDKKPKTFILENVKGLKSHNQGKTLEFIIRKLDSLGYNVNYKVLDATDYGLPQIRKRLFFVGVRKNVKKKFYFPGPIPLKYTLQEVFGGVTERKYGFTVRIGGRNSGINNRYNWDSYIVDKKVRLITPSECMLLQGFDKKFRLLGNTSQQYYQVGNSVPVTIVNEIVKQLIRLKII